MYLNCGCFETSSFSAKSNEENYWFQTERSIEVFPELLITPEWPPGMCKEIIAMCHCGSRVLFQSMFAPVTPVTYTTTLVSLSSSVARHAMFVVPDAMTVGV